MDLSILTEDQRRFIDEKYTKIDLHKFLVAACEICGTDQAYIPSPKELTEITARSKV